MQSFASFIKFSLIGASGTLLNSGIFNLLIFSAFFHHHYLFANLIGFVVAASNNFYWNNRWTFKHQANHKSFQKKYLQFFIISSSVLLFNSLIMVIFVNHLGLNRRLANLLAIAICVFFNYAGNRLYTFKNRSD